MPKKWHKGGCGAEAWTEKCYKCGGNGRRNGDKNDARNCSYCNGHGFKCQSCGGAFA